MDFASRDTPATASSVQTECADLSQDLEARMTWTDSAVPALKIVNDRKPVSRLFRQLPGIRSLTDSPRQGYLTLMTAVAENRSASVLRRWPALMTWA